MASEKLISCILPKGKAMPVMKALKEDKGIITANIHSARGAGHLTPLTYRGVGETTEKEVLDVVVSTRKANEIFEFLYEAAEIDQPHGGLMYMQALIKATSYRLPEIEEEA